MCDNKKQYGFSLIEILIGMTIGLIVILVIMQTMSLFEGQRQRSNSASDMQSNGLLALYALEQDTRQAGYGMMVSYQGEGDLPCVTINGYGNPQGVFDAIPLSINTSGVLDSITIARIESNMGGLITGGMAAHISSALPTQASLTAASGIVLDSISGAIRTTGIPRTVAYYPVSAVDSSNLAYKTIASVGDTVLVSSASGVAKVACSLLVANTMVSGVAYRPASLVFDASGIPNVASSIPVQPALTKLSFTSASNVGFDTTRAPVFAPMLAGSAVMHNLGANPTLIRTVFAVNASGQFTKTVNGGTADVVAENIVSLQAQYGISVSGVAAINRQAIACWVNPTGANTNPAIANYCPAGDTGNWTPAGLQAIPDNMKRIKAIRVAIVARNSLREKATKGVCTTTTTAPVSWLNGPVIDLTANPDWKCYRYKVYQTIIPLHNVILGNV